MMVAAVALMAVSAYGSIKAGQDRNTMYQMQAKQAEVEADRRAVQYEIQANEVLRKVNSANAAVVARGFAGGVSGFEGSAALIQDINSTRGGKEFTFALSNSDMAKRGGLIQATLYEQAGKTAEQSGYFDAAGKLGQAVYMSTKIGSAPETKAGVIDKSENWSPPAS